MKFQQLTGPVMAKGVEDTAFYVYNRLVSLNEVGGEPDRFGASAERFHAQYAERRPTLAARDAAPPRRTTPSAARTCAPGSTSCPSCRASGGRRSPLGAAEPHAPDAESRARPRPTATTSTCSTRRCSAPGRWRRRRRRRTAIRRPHRGVHGQGARARPRSTPAGSTRTTAYDDGLRAVRRGRSLDPEQPAVPRRLRARCSSVSPASGCFNSLAQTLLKLTAPGVPDIYQGTELWDFSLVDPDNRRPVDYPVRIRRELRALGGRKSTPRLADELCAEAQDGRIKLFVTATALDFRRSTRSSSHGDPTSPATPPGSVRPMCLRSRVSWMVVDRRHRSPAGRLAAARRG